jgi:NHL repeat
LAFGPWLILVHQRIDVHNGNFITKFGSSGKEPGQFRDSEHLALDKEGDLYVSDRENNRIQEFSTNSRGHNTTIHVYQGVTEKEIDDTIFKANLWNKRIAKNWLV